MIFGLFTPLPLGDSIGDNAGVQASMGRKMAQLVARLFSDSRSPHEATVELSLFFRTMLQKIFGVFKLGQQAQSGLSTVVVFPVFTLFSLKNA